MRHCTAKPLLTFLATALVAALPALSRAGLLDQPMSQEQFGACVQDLAGKTGTAGRPLQRDDFLRIASGARYDDRVRQSMLVQVSDPTFWWDDIAATTDDQRVAEGRQVLARGAQTLQRIEERWGVPKEVVVAIYGIETNYGPAGGKIPVLDAAISLACLRPCTSTNANGTCGSRERAYAAVRLLRDGKLPEGVQGSWATAFGRTQFVPDTFEHIAVDFDGDGVANLIDSEADAWASTANHLKVRGGWIPAPVYVEVRVPADAQGEFKASDKSIRLPNRAQKASQWAAQGWQMVAPNGDAVPLQVAGDPELSPFLPVGLPGPAFLVSRNFNTIYRYNNSERYVMEVAVLANKLAGGPGIVTPWPTDDPGLSRAEVRQLQEWLARRGHALVTPDGVVGRNTRDAIEAERQRKGMPAGRRVGQRTMRELMQE